MKLLPLKWYLRIVGFFFISLALLILFVSGFTLSSSYLILFSTFVSAISLATSFSDNKIFNYIPRIPNRFVIILIFFSGILVSFFPYIFRFYLDSWLFFIFLITGILTLLILLFTTIEEL